MREQSEGVANQVLGDVINPYGLMCLRAMHRDTPNGVENGMKPFEALDIVRAGCSNARKGRRQLEEALATLHRLVHRVKFQARVSVDFVEKGQVYHDEDPRRDRLVQVVSISVPTDNLGSWMNLPKVYPGIWADAEAVIQVVDGPKRVSRIKCSRLLSRRFSYVGEDVVA